MKILEILNNFIFYPIRELIGLLKSDAISEYLFDGHINLFYVLITFIVGLMVVRFFLRPFTTGVAGTAANRHIYEKRKSEKSTASSKYKENHGSYGTEYSGNGKGF